MSFLYIMIIFYTLFQSIPVDSKINVTIFAITNTYSDNSSVDDIQNTGGHWIAIQQINNNPHFLDNYIFDFQILDAQKDPQIALTNALTVTGYESTSNHIYFPIVIGAPWSSLSTSIAPVLGVFNMGSVSATATSMALSNTDKYPYFYRTIPTDELQVRGIIELCNKFGWNKIAVVYVNDVYGSYFSLEIQALSIDNNIDITSIAISNNAEHAHQTYEDAAIHIKKLDIYVIVLVTHLDLKLFEIFDAQGILNYPYYYLGTDGWFDATISEWENFINLDKMDGFIGTAPWQSDSLDLNVYTDDIQPIINESIYIYKDILALWDYYDNKGEFDNLHTHSNNTLTSMIYGYDAMYVIAHVIDEIDNDPEKYNGSLIDLIMRKDDYLINTINDIITTIHFPGASGDIAFTDDGDRAEGLYSIGNILKGGKINYSIGYFYMQQNGSSKSIKLVMDEEKIVWPRYFTKKKVIPRLDVVLQDQIIKIGKYTYIIIVVLLSVSLLIALILMISLCVYRRKMIIRHSSWRINVIMCIGAILLYIGTILYGIDETYIFQQNVLTIICNLRFWMISISYSLLFMPLFLKTYRLSVIFRTVLEKKSFEDNKLFIYTLLCIIIDMILLSLFTYFAALKRDYLISNVWMRVGLCSFTINNNTLNWLFYGGISIWKGCELMFGIYVGLDVSRIKDKTNLLRRYDETGMQLLSILFTFFIISIAVAIYIFGANDNKLINDDNKPNFVYLIISITILLIGNIVLFFNLFPRIYAVITNNERRFKITPEQRIRDRIQKQFHQQFELFRTSLEINNNNNNNNNNIQIVPNQTPQSMPMEIASIAAAN